MPSRFPGVKVSTGSFSTQRAEESILIAMDHLRAAPESIADMPLASRLDAAQRLLEDALACAASPRRDETATRSILVSILKARCELVDHELSQGAKALAEIGASLRGLRGLGPRAMIRQAPILLSDGLTFGRVMISTIRGSVWLPKAWHIAEATDASSRRLQQFVTNARIPLSVAPLETDLIRRRAGAIARAPASDRRTFKELIEVSGSRGYIAAPITAQGRAIGMIHADRPGRHGNVTLDDLEKLMAYSECLSVAFEYAVLADKAAQQQAEVGQMWASVDAMIDPAGLEAPTPPDPTSGASLGDEHLIAQGRAALLSAREREILSCLATGATNRQIGHSLAISEGTVKSHLKRISKKLNTSSRAAAVAVYVEVLRPMASQT